MLMDAPHFFFFASTCLRSPLPVISTSPQLLILHARLSRDDWTVRPSSKQFDGLSRIDDRLGEI
jgi:hypothetical protein